MNRGKGRSTSTLGDLAPDFFARWKATRPEPPSPLPAVKPIRSSSPADGEVARKLRDWKRGNGHASNDRDLEVKGQSATGPSRKAATKSSQTQKKRRKADARHDISSQACSRIYRPAPMPSAADREERRGLRERLAEISADLSALPIAAAMSRARGYCELPPVIENAEGRLAILGLDFGTAFTKGVVRWAGRHYAVDWSQSVEGEDRQLLASVFSEASDGRCALGVQESPGWAVREGIKLRLLNPDSDEPEGALADAVIFLALVFRHTSQWLHRATQVPSTGVRWRLHVGLPTRSWDDDATTETFKTVAQAARVLACRPEAVTRAAAIAALKMTHQVDRPAVDVFPEFACQLYSYLLSPERRDDLHALVDIGAGTLDVAYFNVFQKDDEAVLPIFASAVERLGAHYLIAALAGRTADAGWADSDSSLSDDEVALKLGCQRHDVSKRRSLYLSSVAEVFNRVTCDARQAYSTSPAIRGEEQIRLFLCGGGSRIPSLRGHFKRIAGESERRMRVGYQVSSLVKPTDIVTHADSGFDRLSVAYGLSQNAANIGQVVRSAMIEPLLPREGLNAKDRDDDR